MCCYVMIYALFAVNTYYCLLLLTPKFNDLVIGNIYHYEPFEST